MSEPTAGLLVNEARILRNEGDAGRAELLEMAAAELDALPREGYYPPGMSEPDASHPGRRLEVARLNADLTQKEAAARMPGSVTPQYWSDVERGRRRPSLEWLWDAAGALGCDPHDLDPRLQTNRRRGG